MFRGGITKKSPSNVVKREIIVDDVEDQKNYGPMSAYFVNLHTDNLAHY
jgi:hypothetical protein